MSLFSDMNLLINNTPALISESQYIIPMYVC